MKHTLHTQLTQVILPLLFSERKQITTASILTVTPNSTGFLHQQHVKDSYSTQVMFLVFLLDDAHFTIFLFILHSSEVCSRDHRLEQFHKQMRSRRLSQNIP